MAEISRILTALGLVMASTGFILYGVAVAVDETLDGMATLSIGMMIVGVVLAVVGIVMSKQIPDPED